MAIFRGFGPRHAAGLAERKFFIFDIIIYHPKEHSVRFSALNSKIFLMAAPFCVVENSEKIRGPPGDTTQKGVAIKKIFELRAENHRECSLGW